MKILFIDNKSIGAPNIVQAMREKQWVVHTKQTDIRGRRHIPELEEELENSIKKEGYDMLFSFNYHPVIAEVCHRLDTRYVSWTYDSPLVALYSYTMVYETNYVFLFDYQQYQELKEIGLPRVFYMPLASNTLLQFTGENTRAFAPMQISFVGSLYNEPENDLYRRFDGISDYAMGYLDALVDAQRRIYGADVIKNNIPAAVIEELREKVPYGICNTKGVETDSYIYETYFLDRKVTALERVEVLRRLSQRWEVSLFSHSSAEGLEQIHHCGVVDYYFEMPAVFRNSQINLNITLKSIKTGIPQRVFDIMGTGGFCLTNYQAELEEYFTAGEQYDFYGSMEELEDKVAFYLQRPELCAQIGASGQEIVCREFSYHKKLDEMMQIVGGEA